MLLLVAGATAGRRRSAALDDGACHLGRLVAGAAVQIPAVWVIGGVAMLLFGVLPRWSAAAWAALGLCALLAEVGPVLELPQAVLDVSPFTAVPRLIGDAAVPADAAGGPDRCRRRPDRGRGGGFRSRDIG